MAVERNRREQVATCKIFSFLNYLDLAFFRKYSWIQNAEKAQSSTIDLERTEKAMEAYTDL